MKKVTLKRQYRSEKLSPKEVARDAEIRRKIQAEFPPVEALSPTTTLSDPLKEAISSSRKTVRQLAKEAQVSATVVTQFMAGQRDLRLATAEKLAHILGLRLVGGRSDD